jgi:hypothetical protein
MSVSVLSVSAIFVSLGTLLLVFGLDRRSRAFAEERFSDLSRQTMLLHNSHSARVLCAVICWLYPQARPGIDFVIDCEARDSWPRIREWRLKTPRPSADDIEGAVAALQEALRDEMTRGTTGRQIFAAATEPSST